ncbi:MAG: hypothetical protein ACRDJ9_21915, partial [Dehalococcoidia bacterium]
VWLLSVNAGEAPPEVIRSECFPAQFQQTADTPDSSATIVLKWGGHVYVHVCWLEEAYVEFCSAASDADDAAADSAWERANQEAERRRQADSAAAEFSIR